MLRTLDFLVLLQGINMTALREIKLLRELTSPHLVRLFDVFQHKVNLCLVRLSMLFSEQFICCDLAGP